MSKLVTTDWKSFKVISNWMSRKRNSPHSSSPNRFEPIRLAPFARGKLVAFLAYKDKSKTPKLHGGF